MNRIRLICVAILVGVTAAAEVGAHTKSRALKEIVRIRGTVLAPDTECSANPLLIRASNRTIQLCESEVQRISVATVDVAADRTLPPAFDLQGERERIAPMIQAGAGMRVIVLGEWRPGRRDLFLLALDVCPCEPAAGKK